jgi:hypothetical protein
VRAAPRSLARNARGFRQRHIIRVIFKWDLTTFCDYGDSW